MTGFDDQKSGSRLFSFPTVAVPKKPRIFISYYHKSDQAYYDRFTKLFADSYDIITDTSIARKSDSDDSDYRQQVIREQYITGSSTTIVLCGEETGKRRWVDWEIHMTLNKKHALLGIVLPTATKDNLGRFIVPHRLRANINSGFAHWIEWTENPRILRLAIETALAKARFVKNIRNPEPRTQRSRS